MRRTLHGVTDGVEVLKDGTVQHLASFSLTDAELRLEGADDPVFAELRVRYADVLGGAPAGMPPDRGIEIELETGGVPMPRSRPVKPLSDGELSELRAQLIDLLDDPALDRGTRGSGRVRAQAGRVAAHLLRLPGPQRHHVPGG